MDPHFKSNFTNGVKLNQVPYTVDVEDQCLDPVNGMVKPFEFGFMDNPFLLPSDPNAAQNPVSLSTDEDSPLDEADFSATVLRYINQMLMEEDLEEKPCMFHDSLALQAAEKSFYEVIGGTYPSYTSIQNYHNVDSPDDSNLSGYGSSGTTSTNNSVESHWSNVDLTDYKPSILQTTFPTDFVFQASSIPSSVNTTSNFAVTDSGFLASSAAGFLDPGSTLFSKSESVLQFERGVEEASKFLPKENPLVIDLENPSFQKIPPQQVVIKAERDEISAESRGRKNHEREDEEADLQDGRSSKQSAVYSDDSEISELLDKVLLGVRWGNEAAPVCICYADLPNGPSLGKLEETNKSSGGKSRVKKQGNKKGVVDLRTLLILCAQAVSSDDRATANELLKQMRQHSSPLGDGTQRLAHCLANALDARLAGTGTQIYTALSHKKTSAADMVKAYQMYISACHSRSLQLSLQTIQFCI
ncbi:Scarecrow protein 14 [Spatholobus suberectus]|nr:Scarecrow protein 14 [Spatholobus suberectus]